MATYAISTILLILVAGGGQPSARPQDTPASDQWDVMAWDEGEWG